MCSEGFKTEIETKKQKQAWDVPSLKPDGCTADDERNWGEEETGAVCLL